MRKALGALGALVLIGGLSACTSPSSPAADTTVAPAAASSPAESYLDPEFLAADLKRVGTEKLAKEGSTAVLVDVTCVRQGDTFLFTCLATDDAGNTGSAIATVAKDGQSFITQ